LKELLLKPRKKDFALPVSLLEHWRLQISLIQVGGRDWTTPGLSVQNVRTIKSPWEIAKMAPSLNFWPGKSGMCDKNSLNFVGIR